MRVITYTRYDNAGDRRGHEDKRRSAASGENAVGGTAPTNEGRDKPFIYDQPEGGGDVGFRGVQKVLQYGPDEVRRTNAHDCQEVETEGNHLAGGERDGADTGTDVQRDDDVVGVCLLYTSPSPRDKRQSRMPSSA